MFCDTSPTYTSHFFQHENVFSSHAQQLTNIKRKTPETFIEYKRHPCKQPEELNHCIILVKPWFFSGYLGMLPRDKKRGFSSIRSKNFAMALLGQHGRVDQAVQQGKPSQENRPPYSKRLWHYSNRSINQSCYSLMVPSRSINYIIPYSLIVQSQKKKKPCTVHTVQGSWLRRLALLCHHHHVERAMLASNHIATSQYTGHSKLLRSGRFHESFSFSPQRPFEFVGAYWKAMGGEWANELCCKTPLLGPLSFLNCSDRELHFRVVVNKNFICIKSHQNSWLGVLFVNHQTKGIKVRQGSARMVKGGCECIILWVLQNATKCLYAVSSWSERVPWPKNWWSTKSILRSQHKSCMSYRG